MSAAPEPDGSLLMICDVDAKATYKRHQTFQPTIYKKARDLYVSLIPLVRPSHCPSVKDKQRRGPRRYVYIHQTMRTHKDRYTLRAVQTTYP